MLWKMHLLPSSGEKMERHPLIWKVFEITSY